MTRIPPAEQLGQLAEQLAMGARQGTEAEDLTSTLVRLGARKLIEELLEAETSDILGGRGRYERRHAGQQGLRNGYKRRHIDCAEGRLEIEVPQIRGVQGVCQPALWAALQRRTDVLECRRRDKMGSPAISVQVGHDLEEFPGKPRTPSQLFAMGLRGCVETPSAPRSVHPEARVFAVRHHPRRRELPVRGPVPPVWPGFPPKA